MGANLSESTYSWLCLMKYFFELYLQTKTYPINDGQLFVECWKQCCTLFKLDYKETNLLKSSDKILGSQDDEEMEMKLDRSDEEKEDENIREFMNYFLAKTIDYINNFNMTSTKQFDTVSLFFFLFSNLFFISKNFDNYSFIFQRNLLFKCQSMPFWYFYENITNHCPRMSKNHLLIEIFL
jgi:hypothetical protein